MKGDIQQLAKRFDWWWRGCADFTLTPKGQTRDNGTPGSFIWKDGFETAAHAYELVRRHQRHQKQMPPWTKLTCAQQCSLRDKLGKSAHYVLAQYLDVNYREQLAQKGWTAPLQWNLRASDTALLRMFHKWIHRERQRKGMIHTRKTREIPARNSPSWRWLEFWDANEIAHLPLSKSEHAMKTKAKQHAEQLGQDVLRALKEVQQQKSLLVKRVR